MDRIESYTTTGGDTIRDATRPAICLLKAGIDFPTVSQWLGHSTLNVTMRYTRADIDLKRAALAQVFPDVLAPPKGGASALRRGDMLKVLIPFTEPAGAERAIRRLLDDGALRECEVELLAIVEPEVRGSARRPVAPATAAQIARETAGAWLAKLGPLLRAASISYHPAIVVGDMAKEVEAALHRNDVDRIFLPRTTPHWQTDTPPVTLIP